MKLTEIKKVVESGTFDSEFEFLYGHDMDKVNSQKARYLNALDKFSLEFMNNGDVNEEEVHVFSAPGRTEISGNHTDHNNGLVFAASVDKDALAIVKKRNDNKAVILSEGYSKEEIDLFDDEIRESEFGSFAAVVRGVAKGILNHEGMLGGFDAYIVSDVLKGSGVSSSAMFEILIGGILNTLYNENKFSFIDLAVIGQYAENVFFGKPSGVMDQTACASGGAIMLDFKNPKAPIVERIDFDLESFGLALVITDTGGDHSDLTQDYSYIRSEMEAVAEFFSKKVLREVSYEDFIEKLPLIRKITGDRAILRAFHYFNDNVRVQAEKEALKDGDIDMFLSLVRSSGLSSSLYNQNAYAISNEKEQGISIAVALSDDIMKDTGAARLQGGGFAGTIQAFVPFDKLDEYKKVLGNVFGETAVHIMSIRPVGFFESFKS